MGQKILKFLVILIGLTVMSAILVFAVGAGFQTRPDVCLQDFSVSDAGSVITIRTSLMGSMGFIRDIRAVQAGDSIHCSFYCCFGGLNSGFGSENTFEVAAGDGVSNIYFDRGEGEPGELVLTRDGTGAWALVRKGEIVTRSSCR